MELRMARMKITMPFESLDVWKSQMCGRCFFNLMVLMPNLKNPKLCTARLWSQDADGGILMQGNFALELPKCSAATVRVPHFATFQFFLAP